MIDIHKAQEIVQKTTIRLQKTHQIALSNALGFVLAEDLISEIDMPLFRQSAMDGYALHLDLDSKNSYALVGEIKAGDHYHPILKPGEAVRIFTGAAVPDSANAVVMQEKATLKDQCVFFEETIVKDSNIRPKGEQLTKGSIALKKGTQIKAAHIGFLTSLGITKVKVISKPRISIAVTGNELIQAGKALSYGKVYESNAAMLTAALNELGYKGIKTYRIEDDFEKTKLIIDKALNNSDMLLVSGGISVGDYDFVGDAFKELNVKEHFYKVKQKPGKPLFYGQRNQTVVFGLPGNPAAALTCFYVYAVPLLNLIQGIEDNQLQRTELKLLHDYKPNGDRAQFLKASIQSNGVQILSGQSSAMIRAFTAANALACIEENSPKKLKGESIEVILLP